MASHPGWYPPGQVCYPPQLPVYLKTVYDLKPIVGVPGDADVIGIHAVIQAANRISGVPGMHDPGLFMGLADHLFSVQMAKYRSKYSLITFPSDATYTPPELPAHISVKLEPVSGAPSDDEMVRVQEALRSYQQFSHAPSMFDAHVNMELSQHLFDLQMARYMRLAGESPPSPISEASADQVNPTQRTDHGSSTTEEATSITNNAGTGASTVDVHQEPQLAPGVNVHELLERSNQLAERLNQLLELSNKLVERSIQPPSELGSPTLGEWVGQVLERLTRLVEQSQQPAERTDTLAERFNELLERFNQLTEKSNQSAQRANQFSERSNELANSANQLAEKANQLSERSNQLSEKTIKPMGRLEEILGNINRVLVGIQHAIVRNHRGNKSRAIDCLVNEKGHMFILGNCSVNRLSEIFSNSVCLLPVVVDGVTQDLYIPDMFVGVFLRFYGIGDEFFANQQTNEVKEGSKKDARECLSNYWSACLN